jgi:hypothetical protein
MVKGQYTLARQREFPGRDLAHGQRIEAGVFSQSLVPTSPLNRTHYGIRRDAEYA